MEIILVVFSILTIVGAWAGWRRSPLYSAKITLQVVGYFLLIVAAMVGASLGILNGPISHSPAAQAILGGITILAVGIGATGLIIRATDAHVAQLPPSVRLVTIHRQKIQRWIWRIVVYLLISGVAALALPSSWSWLPLTLGILVLVGCGPMLMALYMRARRLDRGMTAVTAAPWVHWQYTPAQWEAWAKRQLEWERSHMSTFYWKRDWRKLRVAFIVFAVGAVFVPYRGVGEKTAVFAGCSALVALIASSVNWSNRAGCERHYQRLMRAPPESYFGDEGVFCNGEYSQWTFSGSYLLEATAPRDPSACVQLVFQNFNGTSSTKEIKRVPIPESGEANLAILQRKMREQCRTASVHLVAPA